MKTSILIVWALATSIMSQAQQTNFSFYFNNKKKKENKEAIRISPQCIFSDSIGYGYDLQPAPSAKSNRPFYFSVNVPDGNYKVTVTLGSKKKAGETTVRGESRRLFIENLSTKKGEFITRSFIINKRTPLIAKGEYVKIKPREKKKLNWDNKLTLEFNGDSPQLSAINIEKVDTIPTIFLCGNSTVVDQDNEPWASWGQMIPRFFNDQVCFANYAESGEAANTFIAAGRLKKALTQMKAGDYIFIQFGHNDQKQKGPGIGAYYSFMTNLKIFIDKARAKGAHPVLITPTQRRSFNSEGKITDTHGEYPDAMRWLAHKENIPLIDLNAMTRILYEAMGVEKSKKAFVHYPAKTFPGQTKALADNTHFNPYGAYQIAKCIIEGMKQNHLQLIKYLRKDYNSFDPSHPDKLSSFHWNASPFTEIEKPDGN
ncbi:rhamnogalacturonan acetylesterase [uncultured Bacteroides sp.]|uniref:rhamnogalacturonan acetylesterase n=1 Tax=uncultured Bacteroides sp. TaxID=162156 RepID=UPI002AAA6781|nr:rhamnogalacturonan acetylesterase [uncultured Bacteroides sp.]